jgi:hypothetical protein
MLTGQEDHKRGQRVFQNDRDRSQESPGVIKRGKMSIQYRAGGRRALRINEPGY